MAIVKCPLSLREISGNRGGSACLRKSNYLGEHPARLQDPPANSILQVGTSITNPCYLKREWGPGNLTFTGARCDSSKAMACREENLPCTPRHNAIHCFPPNCFYFPSRSPLPAPKKSVVLPVPQMPLPGVCQQPAGAHS